MSENCSELIISPEGLARIRAACQRRAAELEAARAPQRPPDAPGSSPNLNGKSVNLAGLTVAERFAAAVPDMPANVRRFFQADDPFLPPRQLESAQDRLEREQRASFGGWPGG